ncbi:zinc ABC transporter substrate-binding protein [Candidatus Aerophobetes bacterium]|nr:zinc ABC transporter substrate-binding protein [Candidatus Aerophobetes bacterium]
MLKKVTSYLLLTTFLLGISFTPTALSNETPPEKKVVLTTTTILADFTSRIGKDRLKVVSLIPPGVCPAHYDLKPSDIDAALKAKVIFYHGFEPWLEKLAKSIGAPEEKMVVLKGSWHPFSQAIELVEKIQEELFRIDPQNGSYYEKNADEIVQSIKKTAQEIKQEAQKLNISQYKVICMLWQKSFVEWIGLNIVGSYPPPERISLKKVQELVDLGKREKVKLIIDNLQAGTNFGYNLAQDIGAKQVIFTNFPGAVAETETYEKMIMYNANELFNMIKRSEGKNENEIH